MLSVVVHGVVVANVKFRPAYNPGLAAVVPGHIPLGLYYFYYIHTQGLAGIRGWVTGVAYLLAF